MWEYLSLYAERVDNVEQFVVKNYPEPKERTPESDLLALLGAANWELVAVVPAYGGGGMRINHQLYFKRARASATPSWAAPEQATTRLTR